MKKVPLLKFKSMKFNTKPKRKTQCLISITLLAALFLLAVQCKKTDSAEGAKLELGFLNPPDAAKPRVWWHWMNGNVSKEGITADLEAMKRIGLGGFEVFQVIYLVYYFP